MKPINIGDVVGTLLWLFFNAFSVTWLGYTIFEIDIVNLATGFGLGDDRQYLDFGEIYFFHGPSK